MRKPLAIDLFCGLGGWTDGLLAEGYDVFGFDITRHVYGEHHYPAQLVLQDVLTLHGSQFRNADLIVASPPCQEYSYMAMPWKRAKAKAAAILADASGAELERLNRLFNACFRLQREACEAAGRHIPLILENVRGAQEWVGRARWNYGSFYLWGDVPALMPAGQKFKSKGMNWSDQSKRGQDFTRLAFKHSMEASGQKLPGNNAPRLWAERRVQRLRDAEEHPFYNSSSGSHARKFASATIAKIPLPLSRYIAATFKPQQHRVAA